MIFFCIVENFENKSSHCKKKQELDKNEPYVVKAVWNLKIQIVRLQIVASGARHLIFVVICTFDVLEMFW